MPVRSRAIGGLIVVVAALGLLYAGWRMMRYDETSGCRACGRPIHALSRVVAEGDGEREIYCCPACALAEERQTGKKVEVVELTHYHTHEALSPGEALLVVGSSVNHCLRHAPLVTRDRSPSHLDFDRCSPSALAFASAAEARAFAAENGGSIMTLPELRAISQ